MGRSGKTGWGLSNYFGLTNRKKKLLTKEFLQDFRNELIKVDKEYNEKYNRPNLDYENETYMGFYGQIEGTGLFYQALKRVCEKHNLVKAIYKYMNKLPWYDSDCFEDSLVTEMINKGIIKFDSPKDYEPIYDIDEVEKAKYKIVQHFKGYDVIEYDSWFDDSRQDLEDIYKDSNYELTWLN